MKDLKSIAEAYVRMKMGESFNESFGSNPFEYVKLSWEDEQNLQKISKLENEARRMGIRVKYVEKKGRRKSRPSTIIRNNLDTLNDAVYDDNPPREVILYDFEETQWRKDL